MESGVTKYIFKKYIFFRKRIKTLYINDTDFLAKISLISVLPYNCKNLVFLKDVSTTVMFTASGEKVLAGEKRKK